MTATKNTAAPAAKTLTMIQVKSLFPELFNLQFSAVKAACLDKHAARAQLACAIVGAALEFGISGGDSRLKSAIADCQPEVKIKGQKSTIKPAMAKLNSFALAALESVRNTIKARSLATLAESDLIDWVAFQLNNTSVLLTPAPVTKKAPAAAAAPAAVLFEECLAAIQSGVFTPEQCQALANALTMESVPA